jgi:16S rRNA (guanine1207-N2)-methyltransferase
MIGGMTTDDLRKDIEFDATLAGHALTFHTTWGLFSPKAIDEGTDLLVRQLEIAPTARVLDLGCGYGPLGLAAAKLAPQGTVDMVDKDFVAVTYANLNAHNNGISNAEAYLSNGFDQVPADRRFDVIISNIPAKIGGELLSIFLHDAYARLEPGGILYVVVISGLKDYMKRHMADVFGNYDKLKQSKTYTASRARRQ